MNKLEVDNLRGTTWDYRSRESLGTYRGKAVYRNSFLLYDHPFPQAVVRANLEEGWAEYFLCKDMNEMKKKERPTGKEDYVIRLDKNGQPKIKRHRYIGGIEVYDATGKKLIVIKNSENDKPAVKVECGCGTVRLDDVTGVCIACNTHLCKKCRGYCEECKVVLCPSCMEIHKGGEGPQSIMQKALEMWKKKFGKPQCPHCDCKNLVEINGKLECTNCGADLTPLAKAGLPMPSIDMDPASIMRLEFNHKLKLSTFRLGNVILVDDGQGNIIDQEGTVHGRIDPESGMVHIPGAQLVGSMSGVPSGTPIVEQGRPYVVLGDRENPISVPGSKHHICLGVVGGEYIGAKFLCGRINKKHPFVYGFGSPHKVLGQIKITSLLKNNKVCSDCLGKLENIDDNS